MTELVTLPLRTEPTDDPRRVLENAVIRLLKDRPFYGHLLLGVRREVGPGASPLGLTIRNGTPSLRVDPELFRDYRPAEQEALLEHVLKHLLHLHPVRRRGRHRPTWDVAADLAINPTIDGMPAAAPRPGAFGLDEGLAAEEYARLLTAKFDLGTLDGAGLGNRTEAPPGENGQGPEGAPAQRQAAPLDDHQLWQDADSTPERLAEQVVRELVRDAERKACGEVPADLRTLVDRWLAPPAIPWRQVLRQFIGTAGRIGRQSTWQRAHRRFQHTTPGIRKRRRLNLLVAIDVSESTDRQPLREAFAAELLQIARGRDSRITVLYAHSRIRQVETFRSSDLVAEVFRGGGFTDLRPAFDYARQMQPRPAALIYLTDGCGPAPETMPLPTLWVLTEDGKKPVEWGLELRLACR